MFDFGAKIQIGVLLFSNTIFAILVIFGAKIQIYFETKRANFLAVKFKFKL